MRKRFSLWNALYVIGVVGLALPLVGPFTQPLRGQVKKYTPVTTEMLLNPSPEDWLMYSRTYDAQRFSPLKQITKGNVKNLTLAWSRGLPNGTVETIPIVHGGVIYVALPGEVQAVDGASGDLLWQYKRPKLTDQQKTNGKTKTLAIYEDIVLYTAPDGFVVGIDARTGEQRWETKAGDAQHTSGPIVIEGKVITGRACAATRDSCFIAAHDAKNGKELWKFYNVPGPGEPGNETWGGADMTKMMASTWGLPGTYDPVRKQLYWGIANPMPNTRAARHAGNVEAIPKTAPADLYSNSTVSLNVDTGKLNWYYQHLPGDDWDEDYTHERTLIRTKINPDAKYVKWINPDIPKGQERDVAVMVGEGGGMFVLDRQDGKFIWATPFPFDTPEFLISDIDVKTGRTQINWDVVLKQPGERHLICFFNTRSYWPTAYSPQTNSLYVQYIDNCLDMTRADDKNREKRGGALRPGANKEELAGIAKINLETGEILRFGKQKISSNGALLTTAGDLVFHGDLNRRFRAYDAANGKQLWETVLGGPIDNSTITYAINGKQYVAVMTGDTALGGGLFVYDPAVKRVAGHTAMYVFALP
jgi:alcohol dehydrogenase (cytochrome c)